jgi:hypothetical protein
MGFVQSVRAPTKSSRSKLTDPLTLAKEKILKAIDQQKAYVQLVIDGKPLPKKGDKTVSVWFSNEADGWCASIRYGQASIPLGKTEKDTQLLIGKLDQVSLFFDAVAGAIKGGELDAAIGKLQSERSAALTKTRAT